MKIINVLKDKSLLYNMLKDNVLVKIHTEYMYMIHIEKIETNLHHKSMKAPEGYINCMDSLTFIQTNIH